MTRRVSIHCAALLSAAFTLLVLSVPAAAQTSLLDLDNASASAVADVHDDGGFVVRGAFGTGVIPASGQGTRMMWHPAKGAFRAGTIDAQGPAFWDDAEIGPYSAAFGIVPRASGTYGFAAGYLVEATNDGPAAFGYNSVASGFTSIAAGYQNQASDHSAVALGRGNVASGLHSFAVGFENVASSFRSVAMGVRNESSGQSSIALGSTNRATELGSVAIGARTYSESNTSVALGFITHIGPSYGGSFAFGDRSSSDSSFVSGANQFAARVAGGVRFYTSPTLVSGVTLAPGGSSWASVSDVNRKENFVDLESAHVLDALEAMPIHEWNYIAQDDEVRHIGPTAQDFHAAFGLGSDPLRIETIDADGVALAAIQALIRENRALARENTALEERVDALEAAQSARIEVLEAQLRVLLERIEGSHRED